MYKLTILLMSTALWATAVPVHAQGSRVVFGGDAHYPPFEWLKEGQSAGFNIELERAISNAAGLEAVHSLGDWPDQIQRLKDGDIDALPLFASEERATLFRFTEPFYFLDHGIFASHQMDPKSGPGHLVGYRVVVEAGSFAFDRFTQSFPRVVLIVAANTNEALQWVAEGRADYAVLATTPANQLIRRNALPMELVSPPFWSRPYVFAVHKNSPELAEQLSAGLEQVIESGEYRYLYSRWGALSGEGVVDEEPAYHGWFLMLLLLVAAFLVWARPWRVLSQGRWMSTDEVGLPPSGMAGRESDDELPRLSNFIKQAEARLTPKEQTRSALLVVRFENLRELFLIFGFAACEEIVSRFSHRLTHLGATLVGQVDRDTFVVLLPVEQVSEYLEQARNELGSTDFKVVPMLRAGWTACQSECPLQASFRQAEAAADWAYKQGEAELKYDPCMEVNTEDAQLISDFRRHLTRDLFCVFQPQFDLHRKQLIGGEVLIRWRHPELGMIPPDRFIPLLETAGLTGHVTSFVIDQAIRVSTLLRARGLACQLSVNVSPKDFTDVRLVELIEEKVAEYDGRREDLKLELTETSVAEYPEAICQTLLELAALGVESSIDDFGTGYSSLSYLSTYPIHEVKIDQLFIRDLLSNSSHKAIVRSTIALAHELGLKTVAEGVEDGSTLTYLEACGCDVAQGYYLSKPLEEPEFLNVMKTGVTVP